MTKNFINVPEIFHDSWMVINASRQEYGINMIPVGALVGFYFDLIKTNKLAKANFWSDVGLLAEGSMEVFDWLMTKAPSYEPRRSEVKAMYLSYADEAVETVGPMFMHYFVEKAMGYGLWAMRVRSKSFNANTQSVMCSLSRL